MEPYYPYLIALLALMAAIAAINHRNRRNQAEEMRRKTEELRRKAAEEERRIAVEEKRKADEEQARKTAEDRKRQKEERERKQAEAFDKQNRLAKEYIEQEKAKALQKREERAKAKQEEEEASQAKELAAKEAADQKAQAKAEQELKEAAQLRADRLKALFPATVDCPLQDRSGTLHPGTRCNTNGPLRFPEGSTKEMVEALDEDAEALGKEGFKGQSAGARFEADAARHNKDEIKRLNDEMKKQDEKGPERAAVSGPKRDQKIRFTCSKCGEVPTVMAGDPGKQVEVPNGEVDHAGLDAENNLLLVEVKSGDPTAEDPDRFVRQMERYIEFANKHNEWNLHTGARRKVRILYKCKSEASKKRILDEAKRHGADHPVSCVVVS